MKTARGMEQQRGGMGVDLDGVWKTADNTGFRVLWSAMQASPNDSRALRSALGRFATGVAVVTALDPDGHPVGLTINSFTAVSLAPALTLWCLDNQSHNLGAFQQATHHAIHILSASQQDLSTRFATWPVDRFAGLPWQPGLGGVPLLPGCCACFELLNQQQQVAGDHTIFIGAVERFQEQPVRPPLIFHGGRYGHLAET